MLAERLRRIIIDWEQRRLDIASGFFDPAVWKSLKDALPLLDAFRLPIGKEPDLEGMGGTGVLESLPYNPIYAEMVDGLLTFLRRESVQARLYPSFLHAKAYIFQQIAIVGSSNFTKAGLHRKAELNLVRKKETAARVLREEWFEPNLK